MTTAATTLRPLSIGSAALPPVSLHRRRRHRRSSRRSSRRLAAAALVLAGLSIPVTGAGAAIAATHAPAHVTVAVVADAGVGLVATGKRDV